MNREEYVKKMSKTCKRKTGIVTSPVFALLSFMFIGAAGIEIKMGSYTFFIVLLILLIAGYLAGYYMPKKLKRLLCK